ncbi:hypothetical protein LOD99_8337 [Oopsacas minuta]|uniref:Uncharacterized protein n=1 Tax=Oopsacas minuta TaxID=111878 RepID=A0AAV7JHE9_9METZ|nr:hypothetical protein LOD99_8337 [Oopsacas minuta]
MLSLQESKSIQSSHYPADREEGCSPPPTVSAQRGLHYQGLERTKKQLYEIDLKVNTNIPIHKQATQLYLQGIHDLEAPTKLQHLVFQCLTPQTLKSAISEFGEVLDWKVPDYSQNKVPILTAGRKARTHNTDCEEEQQLISPNGLCIDTNGDVFVANSAKHRVSIFSTLLQYKSNLGTKQLYHPHDVKLTQDCVVVLDWSSKCAHLFSRNGDYLSYCSLWERNKIVCYVVQASSV